MALVNPNIAMSFRQPEFTPRNALAEYAQIQQIQGGQRQAEVADLQLQRIRQTDEALEKVRQIAMQNGGPSDLNEIAKAYLGAPNQEMQQFGLGLLQKMRERTDFDRTYKSLYPEATAATPTNAMASTSMPTGAPALDVPAGAQPSGDYTSTQAMGRVPGVVTTPIAESSPMNAMAPAVAPAAPVNALAAPAAPAGKTVADLRREIMLFSQSADPRAKAMVDVLKGQLTEALKPYVVGGRLVTGTGQELYTAPDKLTDLQSNYEYAKTPAGGNFKGSLADFKVLATPKTTTTINNVAEKAEAGKFGELLIKQYEAISNSAGLAIKTLPGIEANLTILNKGLDTGFGTDAKKAGARILGALGVQDAEKFAADAEMFQSNAINALMQKQLEQKGPQTESDAIRLEQIGAQLGKTKDANRFILDFAKEQLRRDLDQRNFYTEWKKGPGKGSFNGAEDAWFAGEGGKSLFDRPALKKYAVGAASPAAQIPGNAPAPARAAPAARTVVRTGTLNGRRVIQYSDGSTEYGN